MRVGVQARLGIDTIVATRERAAGRLGNAQLGSDSVLAGTHGAAAADALVGMTATLV
jgi:hypothetical protein